MPCTLDSRDRVRVLARGGGDRLVDTLVEPRPMAHDVVRLLAEDLAAAAVHAFDRRLQLALLLLQARRRRLGPLSLPGQRPGREGVAVADGRRAQFLAYALKLRGEFALLAINLSDALVVARGLAPARASRRRDQARLLLELDQRLRDLTERA